MHTTTVLLEYHGSERVHIIVLNSGALNYYEDSAVGMIYILW